MKSLGAELAKLSNPIPIFDPEDDQDYESAVPNEESQNTYQKSELRSRTAPLLEDIDPAYIGRKVSRKSRGLLFDKDDKNEPHTEENLKDKSSDLSEFDSSGSNEDYTEEEDEDLSEDDISNFKNNLKLKSVSDEDSVDSDDDESKKESLVSQFSNIDVTGDIEKGNAIKAQKEIWNKLCEVRIRLQKLLIISNKLPQTESWNVVKNKGGEEMSDLITKDNNAMKQLLNNLISLQCELSKRNTKNEKEKECLEEEIKSDNDDENESEKEDQEENIEEKNMKRKRKISDYSEILSKRFKSEKQYRNSVIQKWDDKVRLFTGRITEKSFKAFNNSAVKQIDYALQNKAKLIKKTQLKRSVYRVLGKPEFSDSINSQNSTEQDVISKQDLHLNNYDSQIYDDDDFYRVLLKDIIESKSHGLDPAVIRKQIELQTKRNKMVRNVVTKASKGRMLRYDVRPKIVNCAAQINRTTISDEARDALLIQLKRN